MQTSGSGAGRCDDVGMPSGPLPGPSSLDLTPRQRLQELKEHLGEQAAAQACAELLEGANPREHLDVMPYLAGRALEWSQTSDSAAYWVRTWGARALRYVWAPDVASAVVAGLDDEHWRPAEMCLKVAALRELGEAGPGAERLSGHELVRVRVAAARCLGRVGDTEHVSAAWVLLEDPDPEVRRSAARALVMLDERLDLGPEIPDLG